MSKAKMKRLYAQYEKAHKAVEAIEEVIRAEYRLIDEEYAAEKSEAQAVVTRISREIEALRNAEDMAEGLRSLPHPVGTVLEEWTNFNKYNCSDKQPRKTGRVGELHLYEGHGLTKAERHTADHCGAVIVVLHKANGKPGSKYVGYHGNWSSFRWIEPGKSWGDWKPLKKAKAPDA